MFFPDLCILLFSQHHFLLTRLFASDWVVYGLLTRKGLVLLTRKGCFVTNVLDSSHDLGLLRSAGLKVSGLPLLQYRFLIRLCPCDCSRTVLLERAFLPAACSGDCWHVDQSGSPRGMSRLELRKHEILPCGDGGKNSPTDTSGRGSGKAYLSPRIP
ncbi:hypothetical protein L195_g028211 [Trifolium pratense]|uniref:Uncharacterized protein n=1 Tax=Trifolium pratense TaxID=57577 RepID=A0A2K3L1A6_TRIPR|nr:hypothetical protein L195_g028211 [Trifolium pratense]